MDITGLFDIEAACDWLNTFRPALISALQDHGALHLRGLPMTDITDFAKVRDVLISVNTPYREKATPRSDFGDGVFSSTDLPASQSIRLHNENSYTLTFPGLLLFGCLTAPDTGGATPVADCRKVLRNLSPETVQKMRSVGWALTRCYSEWISTSWQTAFATEDRADVGRYCADHAIAHRWDGQTLHTSQVRPGVITHPRTGDEVWFNHLAFWNEWSLDEELRDALLDEFGTGTLPFNTAFGDGSPLTKDDLEAIEHAYGQATVRETWQVGDLLLVDNILTAHGRDPFHGDRKIVVAMGDPVDVAACRPGVRPVATFV